MTIVTCIECSTEFPAGFGIVQCGECLTRYQHSANGLIPLKGERHKARTNRLDIPKIYLPLTTTFHERCGVCGTADNIVGTARIQGNKGYRSRRPICSSCSTLLNHVADINGDLVQAVVVDTPHSQTPLLSMKFRSADEHEYAKHTRWMVAPPYIGED